MAPNEKSFTVFTDKRIAPREYATLMGRVGLAEEEYYTDEMVERTIRCYPFIAYARDASGGLVGYLSAFSDETLTAFICELVVDPDFQRHGVGAEFLDRVEERYPEIPIYALPFSNATRFFTRHGYRIAEPPMTVVYKIPE
jgi:GNAT superfamily N-acetyltransferase